MNQPGTFTFDAEREMAEAEQEAFEGFCKTRHLNPADPDTRTSWAVYLEALEEHPGIDPDEDRWDEDDELYFADED